MDKLYSIGQTAKLMGISVQTLRLYSNMGIIKPSYINPDNGYRFYDATTFSTIDRLKYLQKLGFTLSQIKTLYDKNCVSDVLMELQVLEQKKREEIEEQQKLLDSILWYQEYYSRHTDEIPMKKPYIKYFEKRVAFVVDRYKDDSKGMWNERLYLTKNRLEYKELEFRRKFVTLYNSEDFFQGQLTPFKYGVYLAEESYHEDKQIMRIPAGYYICFLSKILTGDWKPEFISHFFKEQNNPEYIIADEYEDSLFRFNECPYEVQLFFSD